MKIVIIFYALSAIIWLACNNKTERKIVFEEYTAEGDISNDTIFNGLIKFYDRNSNKKLSESYFIQNVQVGASVEYYSNGNVRTRSIYKDGKLFGDVLYYDSSGRLLSKDFRYYNLRTGPSTTYNDGAPKNYWFYSLENKPLFQINYDSTQGRKITDIREDFFFYTLNDKITIQDFKELDAIECRLYLIKPPKYNFDYDLVLIDNNYGIKDTIQSLNKSDVPWITFKMLPLPDSSSERFYALRLTIYDSINKLQNTMLKALPTPY